MLIVQKNQEIWTEIKKKTTFFQQLAFKMQEMGPLFCALNFQILSGHVPRST